MRSFSLVVSLCSLLCTSAAMADTQVQEGPNNSRRLGGHLFMYPQFFAPAFVETTFASRTAARYERVDNVPIGPFSIDVNALGVQENVEFALAFADTWSIGINAIGQALTGVSAESLATQGAFYDYGAALTGALRVLRIDSSGTQLAVRAEVFGLQGGGRLSILPLLVAVRNQPRDVVGDIANYGDFLVTPASWWGFAGTVSLAQAISAVFSLQASFRLDVKRLTESPFVPGVGRVAVSSTGVLPQVGVAFGVNPPAFPVSFLLEYRAASQDSLDPTSLAHQLLGLGAYYSARADLQLGVAIAGEFGLPEIRGFDVNGNLTSSDRGKSVAATFMMRYFW